MEGEQTWRPEGWIRPSCGWVFWLAVAPLLVGLIAFLEVRLDAQDEEDLQLVVAIFVVATPFVMEYVRNVLYRAEVTSTEEGLRVFVGRRWFLIERGLIRWVELRSPNVLKIDRMDGGPYLKARGFTAEQAAEIRAVLGLGDLPPAPGPAAALPRPERARDPHFVRAAGGELLGLEPRHGQLDRPPLAVAYPRMQRSPATLLLIACGVWGLLIFVVAAVKQHFPLCGLGLLGLFVGLAGAFVLERRGFRPASVALYEEGLEAHFAGNVVYRWSCEEILDFEVVEAGLILRLDRGEEVTLEGVGADFALALAQLQARRREDGAER